MKSILSTFLVSFGFLGVGAIAIVNLLISWLYNIFDGTSNGAATTDDATATSLRSLLSSSNEDYNAPSVSAIFDDTCYLGVSMLFVLSTLVTLCRLSIWEPH